jgi:hypothetical protein
MIINETDRLQRRLANQIESAVRIASLIETNTAKGYSDPWNLPLILESTQARIGRLQEKLGLVT